MLTTAVAGAAGAAGFMAWAVRGRSSSVFAPSIWHGTRDRKAVALTFDDGPSEATPRVLELLARHGVRATFFQCGRNVDRLPQVARSVREAGHEIGNHTWSHPRLDFKAPAVIAAELGRTQDAIRSATGVTPSLFRAPYGVRWFGLRAAQHSLGLMGVMWTAIGLDWKLSAGRIHARLLRGLAPGAILCLHDGRVTEPDPNISSTLDAVRTLLPELRGQGYQFETVSQILCPTK